MNKYSVFNSPKIFYPELIKRLKTAKDKISMVYLTYEHGTVTDKINEVLIAKRKKGVQVRLMMDTLGEVGTSALLRRQNAEMIRGLRTNGVEVVQFYQKKKPIPLFNRMHCKFCSIDDKILLTGGSNISDAFLEIEDTNLLIIGDIGDRLHNVFDYFLDLSNDKIYLKDARFENYYSGGIQIGDATFLLKVPQKKDDILERILSIVAGARREMYLRSWYFYPNKKIMSGLIDAINKGKTVNVMVSGKTFVSPMNIIKKIPEKKLTKKGAHVFEYNKSFAHAKVYWNDKHELLISSYNLDIFERNFESAIYLRNKRIAGKLKEFFIQDEKVSSLKYNKKLA